MLLARCFKLGLGIASLAIPFVGEAAWIAIAADSASLLGTGLTAADAYPPVPPATEAAVWAE